MKNELQKILRSKVDPVFFGFTCAMLLLVSLTALLQIRDIDQESDQGAALFSMAPLNH